MCVILVGKITRAQHELALKQNGDGFSLFTKEQGLIKMPTARQVRKGIGKFGIWHYRIGTSGEKSTLNVHPFLICGGKYLLYHNGILGDGLGDLSDTHALANTLMRVSIQTARTVISSLTDRNRFVITSAEDPTDFELFGEWVVDAGVLMSHKLHKIVRIYNSDSYYSRGGYYSERYRHSQIATNKDKDKKPEVTSYDEEDYYA